MTQYGCERFASTLAWAYWQDPENCIRPSETDGISGGMAPAAFRALLTSTLGVETQVAPAPVSAPARSDTFTTRQTASAGAGVRPQATVAAAKAVRGVRATQDARTTMATKLMRPTRVTASAQPSRHSGGHI